MHEKSPVLKAHPRPRLGSRYARRDRAKGLLPAVIYGHGAAPVAVSFEGVAAVKLIESGEKVFRLELQGASAEQMILLKDLQFDYLGDTIVHADFARVDLDERVRTRVHIELQGEAKGLKTAGAILMHPTNEIEIECRVRDLPDRIVVEVGELDVDQQITAGEVKLPQADMKLITDVHAVVAQIIIQKEEVTAEAATVGAEAVQPEVIGEKERAEKAAAEAAGKPGAKAPAAAPAAKAAAPKK
ncbi:MAG: 50S ribosomal protein L25 [Phycisphaerae bacterium]|nr:50S ribosomal protein L25 [Phycisphaerae bacterium]